MDFIELWGLDLERKYSAIFICASLLIISGLPAFSASAGSVEGWGTPVLLETENLGHARNPYIAIDSNGNAFAVWRQYDGLNWNVFANRYEIGKGWMGAELIEDNDVTCEGIRIAVDGLGNAIAIWYQLNQTTWLYNIWANRYEVATGWGDAFLLETDDSGNAELPDIAADAAGNYIAVWSQSDGSVYNLMACRYEIGIGWGSVTSIETNNTANTRFSQIAFDDNGNAIVVWRQRWSMQDTVWSNRYELGIGWGTAEQIGDSCDNGFPELTVDRNGNATCVWQHMVVFYEVWGNHYEIGSGWETNTLLKSNPPENIIDPDVASDGNGRAIAVWNEFGISPHTEIYAMDYESGTGWGSASRIIYSSRGDVGSPEIAMNDNGDAIVVFIYSVNSISSIWATQNVTGIGWDAPERISTESLGNVAYNRVSMSEKGNAIAVWVQDDGLLDVENVWANDFTPPDTTPPMLSINDPSDGEIFETSVITVSGTTEPGVTLNINGALAAVETDGTFSLEIALLEGNNTITAIATDASGNPTVASLMVTYNDPITAIQDELDATQDELGATQDELDATQDEFNSALDELELTKDELNATSGDVADLQSQSFILIAILAVFAILAVVMSLICMNLRKKIEEIEKEPSRQEPPLPP